MNLCSARRFALLAALFLCATAALSAQDSGVSTEWDIRKTIASVADRTEQLKPILEQINPQSWVEKGAPEAYVGQWKSLRTQIDGVIVTARTLSQKPEKLSVALDTYFRTQSLQVLLGAFIQGVQKYQNPALASLIQSVADENSANIERLRQHVLDLATTQEAEFKVADEEAQRCRSILLKQPQGGQHRAPDQGKKD